MKKKKKIPYYKNYRKKWNAYQLAYSKRPEVRAKRRITEREYKKKYLANEENYNHGKELQKLWRKRNHEKIMGYREKYKMLKKEKKEMEKDGTQFNRNSR